MSAAAQITAIAVGLAIAAGAGYWAAQLHQSAPRRHWPARRRQPPRPNRHRPASARSSTTATRWACPTPRPEPKKDSMGMDYVPVYADDRADDAGVVVVSPARMQTLGVKTAEVEMGAVDATVRASGRIEIDERSQVVVAPRFEGWIERLHVNAVGDPVKKGQPLFTAYSPGTAGRRRGTTHCRPAGRAKCGARCARERIRPPSGGGDAHAFAQPRSGRPDRGASGVPCAGERRRARQARDSGRAWAPAPGFRVPPTSSSASWTSALREWDRPENIDNIHYNGRKAGRSLRPQPAHALHQHRRHRTRHGFAARPAGYMQVQV